MTTARENAKTAIRAEGMTGNGIGTAATAATAAVETLTTVHLGATEIGICSMTGPDGTAGTVIENGIESANQTVTGRIGSGRRLRPGRENPRRT